MPTPPDQRPPRCETPRERSLLQRMCQRAEVEFTEWECARLLTEFKRNLTAAQWASIQASGVQTSEDALRVLIVFGFENRRLKRLRLRGRGRDRVWAEEQQQKRMTALLNPPKRKG